MNDFNKIFMTGRIVFEPRVEPINSEVVAKLWLKIACNQNVKRAGNWTSEAEFHPCEYVGRIAHVEVLKNILTKGTYVAIEGKLRTKKWQGKNGEWRERTFVEIDEILKTPGNKHQKDGEYAYTDDEPCEEHWEPITEQPKEYVPPEPKQTEPPFMPMEGDDVPF